MFTASIVVASPVPIEDDEAPDEDHLASHPEHAGMLPAGLQALLISDEGGSNGRASSVVGRAGSESVASGGTGGGIGSIYIDLPPLDTPNQPCAKEGFLHKIGGKVKNWKTRYFRLCPGRLLYYKDGESSDRLGAILLPGATIAVFGSDIYPGHMHCFGVTPPDTDRQYVFDCDTPAHRLEWIRALEPCVRQRIRVVADSLREGYLTKLGGIVQNWKTRWCVLTRQALKYYPAYTDLHDCLGTIPLAGGFVVGSDDDPNQAAADEKTPTAAASASAASSSSAPPASSSSPSSGGSIPILSASQFLANNPYNFSVRAHASGSGGGAASGRTYIFCTTTKKERDAWIDALQNLQKQQIRAAAAATATENQ